MIHIHEYPICEYDEERDAIIRAADFLERYLPEKCVITFFRKELEQFVQEHNLPIIGYLHSEVLDIPIYKYERGKDQLCITMPFCTAPGAAGTIEELHAMGCDIFIICGGAGCLQKDMTIGNLILPTAAVRDEGTSYHYLPPAREVVCNPKTIKAVKEVLDSMNISYVTGKTWTTDAFYRETPAMVKLRKEEGYPLFNCPDEVVDGVKNAGFDMLLTANNHSYDTRLVGFKRTLEVIRGKGIKTLGTYLSADETKWTVEEINGIKIGMVSYTYATGESEPGRPSLNNNQAISESGLCNYFNTNNLEAFYTELEGYLEEMKEAGADATILFIHWGVEYMLEENQTQNDMAQALCDLGIDVIIGGHPHVVQPVELLTSTVDPEHRTVCLYSMGNAVSNQRLGFSQAISTAHTEDGILFTVTFEKYSDGTVYLAQVNGLPTWVNKHRNDNGKDEYNILPLDDISREAWGEKYGLNDKTIKACADSFDRTIAIVGEGIKQANDYLDQEKADREAYYLSLVS